MSRTVNQNRAIQFYLKNHWGMIPQLSVPGQVTFRHKVTGQEDTRMLSGLEAEYNAHKRAKEEARKASLRAIGRNVTEKKSKRKRTSEDQTSLV